MIKLIKSTFYREKSTKNKLISFISKAEQLSFGKQCETFEQGFALWQGRDQCVMVNSGSSANLAIIQSLLNLGIIRQGDQIGFSALTWSTNVMPIIQLGLKPVPIDVELDTLNVSSRTLKTVLESANLKALFLTNLLGFCDDIEMIAELCKKRGVVLIEDNCESLGTIYKGKKLGNWGIASTFSYYVGHHMSTIEGGSVCTDNEELATMLRLVRAHGWDRNLNFSQQSAIRTQYQVNSGFYSRYTFYNLGYNLRPTEINGFLGNAQLKYLDEIIEKRERNYHELSKAIQDRSDLFYSLKTSHLELFSNFAVPVICKSTKIRDELVRRCSDSLEIRPVVGGDMTLQPFFGKYAKASGRLYVNPNARLIHNQGLYFGNNPDLTTGEKSRIRRIFSQIL